MCGVAPKIHGVAPWNVQQYEKYSHPAVRSTTTTPGILLSQHRTKPHACSTFRTEMMQILSDVGEICCGVILGTELGTVKLASMSVMTTADKRLLPGACVLRCTMASLGARMRIYR